MLDGRYVSPLPSGDESKPRAERHWVGSGQRARGELPSEIAVTREAAVWPREAARHIQYERILYAVTVLANPKKTSN